ncbi:hypothetical protein MHU86_5081 [Fragilaria crotonensis]|nr:hypothetical protein MHU86_5081 [Fragilaria crotonensis]
MAEDIENFGVPEIFNSAYAESAHIPIAKKTVKNTQKRNETYEIQAAHRYAENLAISHANRQVATEVTIQKDFIGEGNSVRRPWIGKSYSISTTPLGVPQCSWRSNDRKKANEVPPQLIIDKHVLQTMVDYLLPSVEPPTLACQTEYTCPKGVLYRAHPKYDDKPWYDHALVDWDDVATPARILSIVNLHNLKPNCQIKFPHQSAFIPEPGLYIIMQSYDAIDTVAEKAAKLAAKELSMHVSPRKRRRKKQLRNQVAARVTQAADAAEVMEEKDPPIFKSYRLSLVPESWHLPKLYIIQVDSIVGPTVVITDLSRNYGMHNAWSITHPFCPYIFMTRRRDQWADNWTSFIDWQSEKTILDQVAESSEEED